MASAAEQILEDTGFRVHDSATIRLWEKAGARVDDHSGVVRIPRTLLHELLAQAPGEYSVCGIDGTVYTIGGGKAWGLAIVTDPWIIDYARQAPRRPCLDDLRRHTILAQRMDIVAGVSCMDFPVTDVPGPASNLRAWETHLLHFGKHYHFIPASAESLRRWEELLAILGPSSSGSLFSVHAAVISPLTISAENVALVRFACEHGAPVVPTICPMAGSTAPYSQTGTLLLGHAENLFLAALTQLIRPGNPYLYTLGPSVMDLHSAHDLYYTLDKMPWKTGSVQLARHHGLPVAAEAGGTMTYRFDPQNGMEGMLFMLAAVASCADVLAGFGSGYAAVGMSAEMMVIQEAWLDAARHLMRGLPSGDLGEAFQSIQAAGPGGDFLTDSLTLRNMGGGAFFEHALFDYAPAEGNGRSMLERAHNRVEVMTADFESPVPQAVQEKLRRYFHDECRRVEKGGAL